jgi:hypothetical protein
MDNRQSHQSKQEEQELWHILFESSAKMPMIPKSVLTLRSGDGDKMSNRHAIATASFPHPPSLVSWARIYSFHVVEFKNVKVCRYLRFRGKDYSRYRCPPSQQSGVRCLHRRSIFGVPASGMCRNDSHVTKDTEWWSDGRRNGRINRRHRWRISRRRCSCRCRSRSFGEIPL